MAQSAGLHEPEERLSRQTIDRHRALVSVQEELEAVDWYDQRVDAATDAELAAILAHNRDEEKEHASMVLEWLRRHDPGPSAEQQRRAVDPPDEPQTDRPAHFDFVTPHHFVVEEHRHLAARKALDRELDVG